MRIVTYARCSTKSQKDAGTSLQDQEARFTAWLESSGHIRVATYADSISGGKNMRSATVQGMLADLPDLKVGAVVIDHLDRWSRDVWDGITMANRLRDLGITLWELEHDTETPFDLSKDEDLDHITQRLRDAEAERRRAKARQKKRYAQQRARGATCTNKPAFGLTTSGEEKGRRTLVPDENAAVVRECDERILRGESQRSVLQWLRGFRGAWESRRGLVLALLDEDGSYVKSGVRTPATQAALRELLGTRRAAYGNNRARAADIDAIEAGSMEWVIQSLPDYTGLKKRVRYSHDLAGLIACGLCCEAGVPAARAGMQGRHVISNPNPYNLVCEGRRGGKETHPPYMVSVHFVTASLMRLLEKLRDERVAMAVLRAWEKEPAEDRTAKLRRALERDLVRLDSDEARIDARVASAFGMLSRPALAAEAERVIERAGSDRAALAAQRGAVLQKLADLPACATRSTRGIHVGELVFSAEVLFEGRAIVDGRWADVSVRETFAKWVRLLGPPVWHRNERRCSWRFIDAIRPEPAPDYASANRRTVKQQR